MKKNLRDLRDKFKKSDYLTPLLERAPATWALIRANEIRALDGVDFKHPILDVGCGDGFVAKVTMSNRKGKIDVGIDLSEEEIKFAKKSNIYKKCIVGSVYSMPFKDESFETVFSNSVVEHFPDLNQALSEMSRVLKKNGRFIILNEPVVSSMRRFDKKGYLGVIFYWINESLRPTKEKYEVVR